MEKKHYNDLVDSMVKEARELLGSKGLDYEEDVITILKAALVIVRAHELFNSSSFMDEKDDILDDISILYKKRLHESFMN